MSVMPVKKIDDNNRTVIFLPVSFLERCDAIF